MIRLKNHKIKGRTHNHGLFTFCICDLAHILAEIPTPKKILNVFKQSNVSIAIAFSRRYILCGN